MVNIVALLLCATSEETLYEQLPQYCLKRECATLGIRDVERFLLSKEWLKVMQPTPKRPAARDRKSLVLRVDVRALWGSQSLNCIIRVFNKGVSLADLFKALYFHSVLLFTIFRFSKSGPNTIILQIFIPLLL